MDKVLKIGIIGCGAIGKDHCRRIIETVPGATVVAVSDYVAAAADDTAAKYGIRSFGNDCDGMIKDPEVEAVVITSIDPTHHDYVMKTLAEEKWCFCEKPLSQNAKDCEEIINRELEIGKRLVQVGFMRHYDRGYVRRAGRSPGHQGLPPQRLPGPGLQDRERRDQRGHPRAGHLPLAAG